MSTKKLLSIILCLCITVGLLPAGVFSAAADGISADTSWYGDGTADEYNISAAGQLAGLAELVNESGVSFEGKTLNLTANIDLGGAEWVPIGSSDNYFRGTFNGNNYTISGLSMTVGYSVNGLFGTFYGTVSKLTVAGSIICESSNYIGSIAGINYGTISSCAAKCSLRGNSNVSGITGANYGSIINCCSLGSAAGNNRVAGITGRNYANAKILNCYSACLLEGNGTTVVCGIVGYNNGTLGHSYWLDTSASLGSSYNQNEPDYLKEFSQNGTLCTVKDGYETYELTTLLNTWIDENQSNYPDLLRWRGASSTDENNGLPFFESNDYWSDHIDTSWYTSNPYASNYEISTAEQFAGFASLVNETGIHFSTKTITLTKDINLSGNEWVPISHSNSKEQFVGTLDGNGHSISGLYISSFSEYGSTGLFSTLYGTVKNLSVSADITSKHDNVGIIAGTLASNSIVMNSGTYGSVTGIENVGGVAGCNGSGSVLNCYNRASVTGSYYVGGIVGMNKNEVYNCYAACTITASYTFGLLCGKNYGKSSSLLNSYYLDEADNYPVYKSIGANEGTVSNVFLFTKSGTECVIDGQINSDSNLARVLTYGSLSMTGLSRWRSAARITENGGYPVFNDQDVWSDHAQTGWYKSNASEFRIEKAEEFAGLAVLVNAGTNFSGKTVILDNDIDMSEYEWVPIGYSEKAFEGTFDGKGNTISGVSIFSVYSKIGLFGFSKGTIKNVNVDLVIDCGGTSYIGGIAGYNNTIGIVENCTVRGTISGNSECGGIVGENGAYATVKGCVNYADLNAFSNSAGIVGKNYGVIINCGNQGSVTCNNSNAAGIAGSNSGAQHGGNSIYGRIINSYSTGKITTFSDFAAGITCSNEGNGVISNCYTASELNSDKGYNAVVGGEAKGTISYCYALNSSFNYFTTIQNVSTFTVFTIEGNECTLLSSVYNSTDLLEVLNKWVSANSGSYSDAAGWRAAVSADENSGCPVMESSVYVSEYWSEDADTSWYGNGSASSFTIRTSNELAGLAALVNEGTSFEGKTVTLNNNIDLSDLKWVPIGYSEDGTRFAGTFNGNNKKITGIRIKQDYYYNGLFGALTGTVKNLCVDASILSVDNSGIIAGYCYGSIYNCVVSGDLQGDYYVGGIAGMNSGSIMNCFSIADVSGEEYVGGIVGKNSGSTSNCHSSGPVSGVSSFGGIVGRNTRSVSNCFVLKNTCENICGTDDGSTDSISFYTADETSCTLETEINGTTDILTALNNGIAGNQELSEWRLMNDIISENCTPVLSNMYSNTETIDGKEYFLIYNVTDLSTFAQMVSLNTSSNAKLAKDIDFGGASYTPITTFNGIFLGNDHKIKNFTINSSSSYTGFFGRLGTSAKVSDLTFENCTINSTAQYAGLICGQSAGQISNCHAVGGNVTAKEYVGGLVGHNNTSSSYYFRGCTSSASVNARGNYAGGIIGYSTNGKIINCRNSGGILCTGSYVGGIVGKAEAGTIANCANLGNIYCTGSSSKYVGGILGDNSYTVYSSGGSGTNTYNCYNAGYIKLSSSSSSYIGGIAGSAAGATVGVVKNCYWLDGTAAKGFYLYSTNNTLLDPNPTVQTFTCSGTSCTAAKENGGTSDLTTILNNWVNSNNSSYSNLLTSWSNAPDAGTNMGKPVNVSDIYAGPVILEISVSKITISQSGFNYLGSDVSYSGEYILNGKTTSNYVTVNSFSGRITLDNLDISSSSSPISVNGSSATSIVLQNTNYLYCTSGNPAFFVAQSAAITVSGTGKCGLRAASSGAALGSTATGTCGRITIESGAINAASASGVGIGGSGAIITINGGTVTATGNSGAGIGGANGKDGGTITINGGTVTATGYGGGAGIGGGANGNSGKIKITGGMVKAWGNPATNYNSMDIGNGNLGTAVDSANNYIAISGGNVVAVGAAAAPQAYSAEYTDSTRVPVYPTLFNMGAEYAGQPVTFSEGFLPAYYSGDDLVLNDEGCLMLWLPENDYGVSEITVGGNTLRFDMTLVDGKMTVNYGEYRKITFVIDDIERSCTYRVGDPIPAPEIPNVPGYTFEGWIPEIPTTMPDNDISVTALLAGGYIANNDGTHTHIYIPSAYSVVSDCTYTDETVPPTDTEPGYTQHTCSICSYTFTDSIVPAMGHDFDTEWHTDDLQHWHECSRCTQRSEQGNHVWKWVEDIPATCVETGIMHEECSICHFKRNENTVSEISSNHVNLDPYGFCTVCGKGQDPVLNEESNYYEISNVGQLYRFAEMVDGGQTSIKARLKNDIIINQNVLNRDMSLAADTSAFREWSAIAMDNAFNGVFDGNGFYISGLYTDGNINYNGLFAHIGENGVVKNLTIKDSYIGCNTEGGAICGHCLGTIQHCFVNANVTGAGYIGGLAGYFYGTMTNCGADIYLDCASSGAGGLICKAKGTISNCFVTGTINCEGSYIHPIAAKLIDGNIRTNNLYYLDTMQLIINGIENITPVTESQLISGEIAWLLNQGTSGNTGIWSQGRSYPVFADGNNPPIYKVTYEQGEKGAISGRTYVKAGETVTVDVEIPNGYSCVLFLGDTELRSNTFSMPRADCTVSAEYISGGTQKIWDVKIIADTSRVSLGGTLQLNAVWFPSNKTAAVTWSTGKPSVATVNKSGLVKGVALGNVTITATDIYGNTGTIELTVSADDPAVKIVRVDGGFSKKVDWWKSYSSVTMDLDFIIYNCNDAVEYKWFSSNPDVQVENGHITNTGWFSRSSNISLMAYDAQGNIIAKDTVKVSFYKFSWQSRFMTNSVDAEILEDATTPVAEETVTVPVALPKLFTVVLNVFKMLFASFR
ncbi:MAG: Ig-like domain-containing protein [Clostridiales bacterium]|nr:Ig-like domain-containing protein [Clostridiales bacterium]